MARPLAPQQLKPQRWALLVLGLSTLATALPASPKVQLVLALVMTGAFATWLTWEARRS